MTVCIWKMQGKLCTVVYLDMSKYSFTDNGKQEVDYQIEHTVNKYILN